MCMRIYNMRIIFYESLAAQDLHRKGVYLHILNLELDSKILTIR
jgi:hypothetical protein